MFICLPVQHIFKKGNETNRASRKSFTMLGVSPGVFINGEGCLNLCGVYLVMQHYSPCAGVHAGRYLSK